MEFVSKVCVFLLALAFTVRAQDSPLSVQFENSSPREIFTNAQNLEFKCIVNRELMYIVRNLVQIIRRPAMGGDDVILTSAARRVEAEPAFYEVNVEPAPDNAIAVLFKILTVRDIDDGQLICRVTPGDGSTESGEAAVDIVVIRPLDSLKLQFGDADPIMESVGSPLEVDSGTYPVKCMAEGSNPAAEEVHLTLNGNMVPHGDPVVEMMEGDLRKFRVTLEADVELTVAHSGQVLECSAKSKAGDTKSTSVPIKINVYEPEINCTNTKAHSGKMYPAITCRVNHAGLDIESFGYQLADNGDVHYEIIADGTQNKDFAAVKTKTISNDETEVELQLYQAMDWHFDTPFYVLVHHRDGHTSRGVARLIETEGPKNGGDQGDGNSGNLLSASLTTLFLCMLCVWRQTL